MIPKEILDSLTSFFTNSLHREFIIYSSEPLSGGSINHVYRLKSNSGNYCIKYNTADAFPGMFEKERMGLQLLRDTHEIKVPEVITVENTISWSYILLEYISAAPKIGGFMADFAYSLAALHRHSSGSYGLGHDNYMGSLIQTNTLHEEWSSFFIEERLEPQLIKAKTSGYFSPDDLVRFQRLFSQFHSICPAEMPSLVHGDLWSGNYIVSGQGKACLIDPAAYFGHREVDIAMSTLFGGFDPEFYSAYNDAFPMEKGWRERLDIYNLYPLLVHLNLFGAGYLGAIKKIIKRF
jgi:protein-ribulosamine 3-kinase